MTLCRKCQQSAATYYVYSQLRINSYTSIQAMTYVKETFIEIFLINRIFRKNKFDEWTPSSCMALKQGPNWGYWAQNAVKVVKFIKIACFQWS
jgi:hypothetical protein